EDNMAQLTYTGKGVANGDFYLAGVSSTAQSRTMTIQLWDPGDGATSSYPIQVLNPSGTAVPFSWSTAGPCGSAPPCSGTNVTTLDVHGTAAQQPLTNLVGTDYFNDRLLTLTVT